MEKVTKDQRIQYTRLRELVKDSDSFECVKKDIISLKFKEHSIGKFQACIQRIIESIIDQRGVKIINEKEKILTRELKKQEELILQELLPEESLERNIFRARNAKE